MALKWKHLQRRTLLKLTNTKKLNSTSSTEHKTDMNITKINKYRKTEQHFYDGTQKDMNVTKIDKYKKLKCTSTTENKTENDYTL